MLLVLHENDCVAHPRLSCFSGGQEEVTGVRFSPLQYFSSLEPNDGEASFSYGTDRGK